MQLRLGAQQVQLRWLDSQGNAQLHMLPIGVDALRQAHRFSRPPRALALEGAIESIEDAVMPLAAQVPAGAFLLLDAQTAPEGLQATLGRPGFDLSAVEAAFSRLSDLALGRPAAQADVPETPEFAIGLLIVREAMHHLFLHQGHWQEETT